MAGKFTAAVAANRFGLGARPGEIDRIADDPRGALRSQLQGGAPLLHNAALPDTAEDAALREAVRRDQELSSDSSVGRTHEEVMQAARRSIGCA